MHLDPVSTKAKRLLIHSQHQVERLAHKKHAAGPRLHLEKQQFYEQVSLALWGTEELLVVGPAEVRHELIAHIRQCNPPLAERILHVGEWAQHSDEELLEFAQEFFRNDDGEVARQNDYG
jgi:hypothetical protein